MFISYRNRPQNCNLVNIVFFQCGSPQGLQSAQASLLANSILTLWVSGEKHRASHPAAPNPSCHCGALPIRGGVLPQDAPLRGRDGPRGLGAARVPGAFPSTPSRLQGFTELSPEGDSTGANPGARPWRRCLLPGVLSPSAGAGPRPPASESPFLLRVYGVLTRFCRQG